MYNLEALQRMMEDEPVEPKQPEPVDEGRIIYLPPEVLKDFPAERHKFKPATGQRMKELEDSIRLNGILNPLLIRQLPEGSYQILGGHNRRTAAINVGLKKVPCFLKYAPDDDDAELAVIHDNMSHPDRPPSEKGWGYRREMEIRGKQGKRTDLTASRQIVGKSEDESTSSQTGTKLGEDATFSRNGKKLNSYEIMAKDSSTSRSNIHRYIRLTYLIPPLLDLVDQGKLGIGIGVELSYLSKHSQQIVYDFCYAVEPVKRLKESQAKALRVAEADPDRIVDEDLLEELTAKKQSVRFRTLKLEMAQLRDYFPAGTPEDVVKKTIETALAIYFQKKEETK